MTVTTIVKPFGEYKKLGNKGIVIRCTTSFRNSRPSGDDDKYITAFIDLKTFEPDVIKLITKSINPTTKKYPCFDIAGYLELNEYNGKQYYTINCKTAAEHHKADSNESPF